MFVDRVLSRFKIQTKVLLFVLPFVVSISAVGLTGLYASGLLEGRMTLSNHVLQSLSGFKELAGAMHDFLEVTDDASHEKVTGYLKAQHDALSQTLGNAGGGVEGTDKLKAALTGTARLGPMVEALWALHADKVARLDAMHKAQQDLETASAMVAARVDAIEKSIQQDDSSAKSVLRQADFLNKTRDLVGEIAKNFYRASEPAEKIKAFKDVLSRLNAIRDTVANAVPKDARGPVSAMDTLLMVTAPVLKGEATPEAVARLEAQLKAVSNFSLQLSTAASRKSGEAIQLFSQLDGKIIGANSALTRARVLSKSMSTLQLVASEFRNDMNAASLAELRTQIAEVAAELQALGLASKNVEALQGLEGAVGPVLDSMGEQAMALVQIRKNREATFNQSQAKIDSVWKDLTEFAETQKQAAGNEKERANGVSMTATVLGIVLSISGGIALVLTLQRPIGQITGAMRRLAEGYLDTAISGEARADEIGEMARALGVFKDNALTKLRVEEESAEARAQAEAERRRNDEDKRAFDQQIEHAVSQLAAGLGRLARGDLSVQLDTAFAGRLDQLRVDFNASVGRLQDTMVHIQENAVAIQSKASDLLNSAGALARRTESQAASLEETAASVDQITVTVASTADRAHEANAAVFQTKSTADNSATVVKSAISAMGRIEEASKQIEQIIEVIDEIAFQTNLLALNAGIEAARAGDAGKGFAVVAMEVRELAQRSAEAAREIKALINKSSDEVTGGSRLVSETGTVLTEISRQIVTINQHVQTIATAAQDQAAALQEINASVNNMDQMTQQNAAAASLTTDASRDLSEGADRLMALVNMFQLPEDSVQRRHYAA